jgi:hypothetical protein
MMTTSTLCTLVIVHGLVTLGLFIAACATTAIRDRRVFRWYHVGTRLFSVLVVGVVLFWTLPRFKEAVIGFGVELPALTVMAIQLSDVVYQMFLLFSIVVPLALAAEMVLIESCLRREAPFDMAKVCSSLVTGGTTLILLFVEFGAALAIIKLLNDLS